MHCFLHCVFIVVTLKFKQARSKIPQSVVECYTSTNNVEGGANISLSEINQFILIGVDLTPLYRPTPDDTP